MRRTTTGLSMALAVSVVAGLLTTAMPAAGAGPGDRPGDRAPTMSDGYGIHVTAERQIDPRLLAVTVTTPALPGPANIGVLLPSEYAAHPGRRYPVLYLLHGTSGGASDWTTMGDAERTTAGLPVIVVMPDIALGDGGGGWCTNWYNGGAYGRPEWETFHISQLIPWVDHGLRTIGARRGRAIAGLSQGGFCSMSYAARHPDLFGTALAYSGAPDIAASPDVEVGSTAIINATEVGLDRVPPNSMFGDRVTQEVNWADHDAATLAQNLRSTDLSMYFGNGEPGPLDPSPVNPSGSGIEAAVARDNVDFHDRLGSLGIPSYYDAYGPGTHTWPYWARDLRESIPSIMDDFAHPPAPPSRITYTIADQHYSIYGWDVTMHRPAMEFSTLEGADAGGFALAGSGSGSVTTPASYRPGTRYSVMLRGDTLEPTTVTRVADSRGRLHLDVPLGPGNPFQQDTAAAAAAGTKVYTTTVRIQPLPTNRSN
ncbi:MAG TPA: alpha/beta hydrolase family protein [Acidimicrobiales bacterium]|nr:alpha/beta hydrolase family protein [Acidimicrobiales bacterium]